MSHFFLSYARRDYSPYLEKFHDDLCTEVGRICGEPKEKVSFFDGQSIEAGVDWPETLSQGLQECRVCVPLFTPFYFKRDYCGKAWQVFLLRLQELKRAAQKASPPANKMPVVFVPVLWEAQQHLPVPLPDAVRTIQYEDRKFPQRYLEEGLRYLRQMRKYHDPYFESVRRIAVRIKDAQEPLLPALTNLPPLHSVNSAFLAPLATNAADAAPGKGPGCVDFVFVAGQKEAEAHGNDGAGAAWRPFGPAPAESVLHLAEDAALAGGFSPAKLPFGDDLTARLHAARQDQRIVALVVDPHTLLHLPAYAQRLAAFDANDDFWNCVVIVVWGTNETGGLVELRQTVAAAFPRKSAALRDPSTFLDVTGGSDEFQRALITSLNRVRARIVAHGESVRRLDSDIARPVL